ncbi:MAG: lipoyl(octanoyl) transferase LipB [Gemmatimonadota bacterium]
MPSERDRPTVHLVELGRVPYRDALTLQRRLAEAKVRGVLGTDFLLLVEHPPVITLGRGALASHVVLTEETLRERGVDRVEIERGGDVTYHGPGQLVGYPILDLGRFRRDLHWYLRRLEETLIRALGRFGLAGFRVEGFTGVWVGDAPPRAADADGSPGTIPRDAAGPLIVAGRVRKIASIGVHASRWITRHGFALNVTDEPLDHFEWIVPCGIDGVRMTSLHREGCRVSPADAGAAVAGGFARAFAVEIEISEAVPAPALSGDRAAAVPPRTSSSSSSETAGGS